MAPAPSGPSAAALTPLEPMASAPGGGPILAASQPNPEFDVGAPHDPDSREQTATAPVRPVAAGIALKKRWASKVGKTTFRTTMAVIGDRLVIGTHGATLGGKNEPSDGVYVLDAKSGKTRLTVATPGQGDRDVGGIAVDGDRVYFTTDNAQIVAASLIDGKVAWRAQARGKVRPAPALGDLNGDNRVDVVVGDEEGVLRALDGATGQKLWTVATGVNDYQARGFIAAAAISDLDGDKRLDVVAGARDGVLAAYRGSDGRVLWQVSFGSGIHASPSIADFDQDGRPEVLAAWSYGDVAILDGASGNKRWVARVALDKGGIEGLFGSPTPMPGKPGVLIVPTAWWDKDDGVVGLGVDTRTFKAFEGRVSASAVVTELAGRQVAVIGTERGRLMMLTSDGGVAELAKLGGPIEAPALVADADLVGGRQPPAGLADGHVGGRRPPAGLADGDSRYELFVASNDGLLTCFDTGSQAKPEIPRFRGESPHNRGELGSMKLGWRSDRAGTTARTPAGGQPSNIRIDYLVCCSALQQAATRAPVRENVELLRAAATCNALAAANVARESAIVTIDNMLKGKATLPSECR